MAVSREALVDRLGQCLAGTPKFAEVCVVIMDRGMLLLCGWLAELSSAVVGEVVFGCANSQVGLLVHSGVSCSCLWTCGN